MGNDDAWGVDEDSVLRKSSRELVAEALTGGVELEAAAWSIAARLVNVTAKELEVDWYRAVDGPLEVGGEDFREINFDDPRNSDQPLLTLSEQNVLLEVPFSEVHFPDKDRADSPASDDESRDTSRNEQAERQLEDGFENLANLLNQLNLTAAEIMDAAKHPTRSGLSVDVLRQVVEELPAADATPDPLEQEASKARAAAQEGLGMDPRSLRERFETGITMLTFEGLAQEVLDALSKYNKMANEIVDSEKLAAVLRTTLLMLKKLVTDDEQDDAQGFRLDILPSLKKEPTPTDPERTLIVTLVTSLLRASPGALPIDDMPTVTKEMISMPLLEDVESSVTDLYNMLETVSEFCEGAKANDSFAEDARRFLTGRKGAKRLRSQLISQHGVLRVSLQRLMAFFGEDNMNSRVRQMFVIRTIWEFTRDIETTLMRVKSRELSARLASVA